MASSQITQLCAMEQVNVSFLVFVNVKVEDQDMSVNTLFVMERVWPVTMQEFVVDMALVFKWMDACAKMAGKEMNVNSQFVMEDQTFHRVWTIILLYVLVMGNVFLQMHVNVKEIMKEPNVKLHSVSIFQL